MSGPKSSIYTLTPEQRKILAEQRRIERQKAVANETLKRRLASLKRFIGETHSEVIVSEESKERLGSDGGYSEKVANLNRVISTAEALIARVDKNSLSALQDAVKKTAKSIADAELLKKEITSIVQANEANLRLNIVSDLSDGLSASFTDLNINKEDESAQYKTELMEKINKQKSELLPGNLCTELEQAIFKIEGITDIQFLRNYNAVTIVPLLKQCDDFLKEYENHHDEYELLYSEYIALCELYHYATQNFPFSAQSVSLLREEIERIKLAEEKSSEQSYISQCLDEVMSDMGYSVIGSREVTKKNGKHFRNELYSYGDGTAVNITYSPDGRIAMELGGIDTTDRTPTNLESEVLCEAMENFCGDFKEIEKRLLEKGVVVANRISLLPPDTTFAQIINTSDYEIQSQVESFSVKEKRHRITEKKSMKME